MKAVSRVLSLVTLIAFAGLATADDSNPIKERQSLMEDVKNAAGPVGKMLRGDLDYDQATFMDSMEVFLGAGYRYGDLFPEGSEFGNGTEASPAIWSDREGFNAALKAFVDATKAAKAANPANLDDARPVAGPIFRTCKGCHDDYRIDD